MTSLCGVWWCFNTIFMANTFPKLRKALLELISSVLKEDRSYLRSRPLARTRTKQMANATVQ